MSRILRLIFVFICPTIYETDTTPNQHKIDTFTTLHQMTTQ